MGSEWGDITLGDFVSLQRGHDLTEPERRIGCVPVMGSAGQNGFHDTALAKGPGIVIGRSGASFGQVHFSKEDFWPHNTGLYVTDFKGNDPLFAFYFLKALDFDRFNSGSAQPSLNRNFIYPIPIRVPGPTEQKAIASILGALDDKIELNRRMNATLEGMARALFQSWFVDFDPVRAKLDGRKPEGMDKATAALFPAQLDHKAEGVVPSGWRATTLGDVIEIFDSKRIPLSGREREARQGNYPYHGAASVMDYVDDFLFNGIYALMGEDGSVINDDGTPVLQYVWGKFWVNNHAHVLRGKDGISTEHLLLHLKGSNIAPFVNGAVQAKLNQGNMNRIPFICPPPEIGQAFSNTIDPLFAQIRANTEQSRTLATLRDTLLPKLLSGELSVASSKVKA
jgi:restriction endonuclease S subunit